MKEFNQIIEEDNSEQVELTKILCCKVHDQRIGIDIKFVREVTSCLDITPVFNVKPYVRGVINLRGEIVAIIDAGIFFGYDKISVDKKSKFVIIHSNDMIAGLLVSDQFGFNEMSLNDLENSPALIMPENGNCIEGIIHFENEMYLFAKPEKILSI